MAAKNIARDGEAEADAAGLHVARGLQPEEQLDRMFLRDSAEATEPSAPDAFLSK